MIHLEPDILECEVKWALGSITTSKVGGGDGIPAELFQILIDDVVTQYALMCFRVSTGRPGPAGAWSPRPREWRVSGSGIFQARVLEWGAIAFSDVSP